MRSDLFERAIHSSTLIPYSTYRLKIPYLFTLSPIHWHTETEISYVTSGCGEFTSGNVFIVAHEGDIIISPPNTLHSVKQHKDCSCCFDSFVFSPQMLGADENDRCTAACIKPFVNGLASVNNHITKKHPYYEEIKTSVENIFSCAIANTAQHDLLIKSELLRIFWLLQNNGDIYMLEKSEISKNESLRPAFDYINENYKNNITIEKLAEITHFSKSYFMAQFKATTGFGALEYLTQIRTKNACRWLEESKLSISDIAFECGFRNLSNFNKQFKKLVGCTPREYRKIVISD